MITDNRILELAIAAGIGSDEPENEELIRFARLVLAEQAGKQEVQDVEPATPKLPAA